MNAGRFKEQGVIMDVLSDDSYLIRNENGKLLKKRHCDLKELKITV
jgi:hypothetical protein